MDPDIKRILYSIIAGQIVWMMKDIFMGARTQTQKNTEDIGGINVKIAKIERDVAAAHSSIREIKGRK